MLHKNISEFFSVECEEREILWSCLKEDTTMELPVATITKILTMKTGPAVDCHPMPAVAGT